MFGRHVYSPEQTRIVSGIVRVTSVSAWTRGEIRKPLCPRAVSQSTYCKTSKMPHCMVPLCTNGWRKTKGTDISYHRLPTGSLKNIWLRNVRRENPRKSGNSFVCSEHFTPDSFEPAIEICGFKKARTLKPSAVPTLFSFPTRETKARESSLRQIQSRAKNVSRSVV